MTRTQWLCASVLSSVLADTVPAAAQAEFVRRTSLDAMVHWESERVRLLVDPALEQQFGAGVRDVLEAAAQAWDLGGPVPRVELVDDVSTARDVADEETVNRVGFAQNWTFGDKLAVTVSTYDAASGALVAAQVWINPDRKFALDASSPDAVDSYDLQAVLTHEFGHVLGLGEADNVPEATMYPTFKRGEIRQRTLSDADESEVDELYERTAVEPAARHCAVTSPGARRGLGWPLFALGLAGLLTAKRRRTLLH